MRTSLNDIALIEKSVARRMSSSEVIQFEERLHRDATFSMNVILQTTILKLVKYYHRRKLRQELMALNDQLMTTEFNATIQSIFNP